MSFEKTAFVPGLDLYWLLYTFQIIWSVWESVYYIPNDAGCAEKCMMLTGYPTSLWSCVWDSHIRQILQRNMWDHVKSVLNLSILRKYTECNQGGQQAVCRGHRTQPLLRKLCHCLCHLGPSPHSRPSKLCPNATAPLTSLVCSLDLTSCKFSLFFKA